MLKIYKYTFPLLETFKVKIHAVPTIIHVGLDPLGKPCFWAEVNTSYPEIEMTFHVAGTGWEVPDRQHTIYTGSFVQGEFVWHLYREPHS